MKRIAILFLFYPFLIQNAASQNIGIGNTSPLAKLDISGDIALRSSDLTVATTNNYALDVNVIKQAIIN